MSWSLNFQIRSSTTLCNSMFIFALKDCFYLFEITETRRLICRISAPQPEWVLTAKAFFSLQPSFPTVSTTTVSFESLPREKMDLTYVNPFSKKPNKAPPLTGFRLTLIEFLKYVNRRLHCRVASVARLHVVMQITTQQLCNGMK